MHPNTTIKNGKKVKTVKPFEWGKAQQEAFDQLNETFVITSYSRLCQL